MLQKDNSPLRSGIRFSYKAFRAACVAGACGLVVVSACNNGSSAATKKADSALGVANGGTAKTAPAKDSIPVFNTGGPLDTALYTKIMLHLANGDSSGRWPVKAAYPNAGAIFPFHRVVAYYGNLYSKNMGILGEYPPTEMLSRLKVELKKWQEPILPYR